MKNSTMNNCDIASSRIQIRRISLKNRIKITVTSALLLMATNAMAGIEFLPTSGMYVNPEFVPVEIQNVGDGKV